jgi:hypothetical protein
VLLEPEDVHALDDLIEALKGIPSAAAAEDDTGAA